MTYFKYSAANAGAVGSQVLELSPVEGEGPILYPQDIFTGGEYVLVPPTVVEDSDGSRAIQCEGNQGLWSLGASGEFSGMTTFFDLRGGFTVELVASISEAIRDLWWLELSYWGSPDGVGYIEGLLSQDSIFFYADSGRDTEESPYTEAETDLLPGVPIGSVFTLTWDVSRTESVCTLNGETLFSQTHAWFSDIEGVGYIEFPTTNVVKEGTGTWTPADWAKFKVYSFSVSDKGDVAPLGKSKLKIWIP